MLEKSLVSPASHLFRQGSFTDFHLSHILFKTEGDMEVISCHVICCRQSEPWFVGSFGSKSSQVSMRSDFTVNERGMGPQGLRLV